MNNNDRRSLLALLDKVTAAIAIVKQAVLDASDPTFVQIPKSKFVLSPEEKQTLTAELERFEVLSEKIKDGGFKEITKDHREQYDLLLQINTELERLIERANVNVDAIRNVSIFKQYLHILNLLLRELKKEESTQTEQPQKTEDSQKTATETLESTVPSVTTTPATTQQSTSTSHESDVTKGATNEVSVPPVSVTNTASNALVPPASGTNAPAGNTSVPPEQTRQAQNNKPGDDVQQQQSAGSKKMIKVAEVIAALEAKRINRSGGFLSRLRNLFQFGVRGYKKQVTEAFIAQLRAVGQEIDAATLDTMLEKFRSAQAKIEIERTAESVKREIANTLHLKNNPDEDENMKKRPFPSEQSHRRDATWDALSDKQRAGIIKEDARAFLLRQKFVSQDLKKTDQTLAAQAYLDKRDDVGNKIKPTNKKS